MKKEISFFRRAAVATVATLTLGGVINNRAYAADVGAVPGNLAIPMQPKPHTPEQERRAEDFMNAAIKLGQPPNDDGWRPSKNKHSTHKRPGPQSHVKQTHTHGHGSR